LACPNCIGQFRDRQALSPAGREMLQALQQPGEEALRQSWEAGVRREVRQVLSQYVTYLLGRQPRLLPYLGS
jgi:hypothetical protein